jgi:hypothetical protein
MWDEADTKFGIDGKTLKKNTGIIDEYEKIMENTVKIIEESHLKIKRNNEHLQGTEDKGYDDINETTITDIIMASKREKCRGKQIDEQYKNKLGFEDIYTAEEEKEIRLEALSREYKKATKSIARLTSGSLVECCFRKPSKWESAVVTDEWYAAEVTRVNHNETIDVVFSQGVCEKLLSVPKKYYRVPIGERKRHIKENLSNLQRRWSTGTSWIEEWRSLKSLDNKQENKTHHEWNTRFPASERAKNGGLFYKPVYNSPRRLRSPKNRVRRFSTLKEEHNFQVNARIGEMEVQLESKVIACIIQHEDLVQDIKDVCRLSVARFQKAITQKTAVRLWDPLTERFGLLRMKALDVVESIIAWRENIGKVSLTL